MSSRNWQRSALGCFGAVALIGGSAHVPSAAAQGGDRLDVGVRLLQQPDARPWAISLELGAELDASDVAGRPPLRRIQFSFPPGAAVHSAAFKTCSATRLAVHGPGGCPAGSKIGSGSAVANALDTAIPATLTVFNGPNTARGRKVVIYARALQTVVVVIEGTLRPTSGRFGYVLDLKIPPIHTVGAEDDARITGFSVTVGGYGRSAVPFIEAPARCGGAGWPFLGRFTFADGSMTSAGAAISCTLRASPATG